MKGLKKIYYVPGLISAIIIPILFWHYGSQKLNESIPNVMDIGLPPKESDIPNSSFGPYRNWDYKKIVIKPNTARQNSQLYVSEIKKLQEKNIKETGIEFILEEENSYDDFVSILNDFGKAKQEYYLLDLGQTNNFFVMVNYKDPTAEEYKCLLCNDNDSFPYERKGYYKFQFFLSKLPEQAFYILFAFLIFINISMFSIKERFLN